MKARDVKARDVKARDVMARAVATVTPETPLGEAIEIMLARRISGLPVVDASGAVAGILTEGDLLRRVETGTQVRVPGWRAWLAGPGRGAQDYVRTHARRVGEVMTQPVVTVAGDASLSEIVALMESRGIKRVPVLEAGRLAGIVSRADLLRALGRLLPRAENRAITDAELRRRVLAELDKQRWAPHSYLDVKVENGVAELLGLITDARERDAMRVLTENVPGVRGVVDHLTWIEPYSGIIVEAPTDRAS
jgi:CBS domain-containing protein